MHVNWSTHLFENARNKATKQTALSLSISLTETQKRQHCWAKWKTANKFVYRNLGYCFHEHIARKCRPAGIAEAAVHHGIIQYENVPSPE